MQWMLLFNFDGFPLNRSMVWVGNIMTLVEWFQFFKSVSLANAWIALDWNGTNERWHASNSHAKTGNFFFSRGPNIFGRFGNDPWPWMRRREQGVCWPGFLEIPIGFGGSSSYRPVPACFKVHTLTQPENIKEVTGAEVENCAFHGVDGEENIPQIHQLRGSSW